MEELSSRPDLGPSGTRDKQHDPAGQHEGTGYGRDKVAGGGLKVHAEDIHGLSRGLECDAGVGQHHDTQRDQYDGNCS